VDVTRCIVIATNVAPLHQRRRQEPELAGEVLVNEENVHDDPPAASAAPSVHLPSSRQRRNLLD
jgi:hypothetical protein